MLGRPRNPQHCPACAQLRCTFTQVIHRFVHREACPPADGKLPAGQQAAPAWARLLLRMQ